jgi:phosphoesterase RecJ-like protein
MTTRQERVGELIKREVSQIIQKDLRDPRIGFVTVTDAQVSRDLKHARVLVSFFGDPEKAKDCLFGLESARGYVRAQLAQKAELRAVPEIDFGLDQSIEGTAKIDELLQSAKAERPGELLTKLDEAARLIDTAETVVIVSHAGPDGDAVGSVVALGLGLASVGKAVTMACPDPVPELYSFVRGSERIVTSIGDDARFGFDLGVALDCDSPRRAEALEPALRSSKYVLNTDHHASNTGFGDVALVSPRASASGELVYELLGRLAIGIDEEIAEALYVAILTDTGSFRQANATSRAFSVCADLIGHGVLPHKVARQVYESKPLSSIKLAGLAAGRAESTEGGAIVWSWLQRDDFKRAGATDEQTEGIVELLRAAEGAAVAVLFTETEDGKTRASFRSNSAVDVARLASEFSGGGHPAAAGCSIAGPPAETRERVISAAQSAWSQVPK